MAKAQLFLGIIVLLLTACSSPPADTPLLPPPTTVPISDDAGNTLSTQEGPLWVLLSGVDEHGLIAEPELTLLTEPEPSADPGPTIPTGIPAAVHEIRQTGPQSLRRFYRVQTTTGQSGWISDYNVRRVAYLYQANAISLSLYETPDGRQLSTVANVTPVLIKEPTRSDWWLVQVVDSDLVGWVPAATVKESPAAEFLLNQHEH